MQPHFKKEDHMDRDLLQQQPFQNLSRKAQQQYLAALFKDDLAKEYQRNMWTRRMQTCKHIAFGAIGASMALMTIQAISRLGKH
jgi:hypothetical protein